MLKILFLFSIVITTVLTALQIFGFQVVELIIIMIIIDFLSLGAYIELENKKVVKESRDFVGSKLEGIEKVCNDIFTHVTSSNPGLEAKIERQRNDISYILDKISKKSLELEERLNLFGRVLSNSLSEKKEEEKTEEKEVEEEKPESYSVGEIVYIDDEENK
jgi:hypothetical protein